MLLYKNTHCKHLILAFYKSFRGHIRPIYLISAVIFIKAIWFGEAL